MNRNQIYNYLKGMNELRPLAYKEGRGFYIKFVPEVWTSFSWLQINSFYIENWYSIILHIREIIIEGEMGDMELHIKYEDIEKFDAYIEEGYKVVKG